MSETPATIPRSSRPLPRGYGIPTSGEGELPWSYVTERMTAADNYWVSTASPSGSVHSVPLWGIWLDGCCYFTGGSTTRWHRNLTANPSVSVHLEDATNAVMLEGEVHRVGADADPDLLRRIAESYRAKYQTPHDPPYWALRPTVVYGWSPFPATATKWTFEEED